MLGVCTFLLGSRRTDVVLTDYLIWVMQGMMKADHEFYKEHGMYDFPQKEVGRILMMKAVGAMISNPKLKAKMGSKMTEGMLAPYEKVLKKCGK